LPRMATSPPRCTVVGVTVSETRAGAATAVAATAPIATASPAVSDVFVTRTTVGRRDYGSVKRSAMRSKKPAQPCSARRYCSADMLPRCSKSISVRPSPRSVSTTVTSSYASPGRSANVSTSRSGATTSRYSPCQWISWRSGPANIVARHEPPGLTSIETLDSGTWASAPPNQSAKRSGSVHSRHTCSRGASKTRETEIPTSGIRLPQAFVEPVEAALPEVPVRLEPLDSLAKRCALEAGRPKLRRAAARDQPRALEHLEMLGHRLDADRERLGELVHRRVALREPRQDRAPRRVGERRERRRELVGHSLFIQLVDQLSH